MLYIFLRSHARILALFAITISILYGSILSHDFIHDDHGQIEQNIYIQSLSYLPKVITGCIWEAALGSCTFSSYYRPIQSLSYLFTYSISHEPWAFYLVNLFYFWILGCLVFLLAHLLTENKTIAFLTAFFFIIHPINTEVVAWIAAVPELTYTIFLVTGTILHILYRKNQITSYEWVYGAYGLGIASKEPAVFLPIILLILDYFHFKKSVKELITRKEIIRYILFIPMLLLYLGARMYVLGSLGTDGFYSFTPKERIVHFFSLLGLYLKKLIYPYPLNFFYEFGVSSLTPTSLMYSFLFCILFSLLAYTAFRKNRAIILFACLWIFIFLSPALIFINSLGENVFSERYAFASGIGFSLLVALLANFLMKRYPYISQRVLRVVFLLVIILASSVVIKRTFDWKNDVILYNDTLIKNPNADLILYNYAVILRDNGEYAYAKTLFESVIAKGRLREPWKAHNNLGNILRMEGNTKEAFAHFKHAIEINKNHREAYSNIGALFIDEDNPLAALPYLCEALTIDPQFKNAENNFAHAINTLSTRKPETIYYEDMVKKKVFIKESGELPITFKSKECNTKQCSYFFSTHFTEPQIMLPFIIMSKNTHGIVEKAVDPIFNSDSNTIILSFDKKTERGLLDFIFPTCNGTYYSIREATQ
ncbi:MAG: hypothetical protein A2586_00625 [Candidatus Harrisonbacteria bacterium RIFOXYD1_FULL_40_9]|uniref:Uncharacterized protein n=1 Tax=Candidatus Harrisonbacteria bacterium RIFOXYD1_FULL_40_9 TaxID=1798412 RepID=A0A1G1ZW23_9BACT|nr:MAG: hypothetical protein A2586_00625 [Candidatus Harrisonbacteria bacterium RIFOXYD1_FULL_40_9]